MTDILAEARKEWPTPLSSMDYLDGYLDFIYTSDMPDGAWFAALVSDIETHWPDADGHESLMTYLEWKADQSGLEMRR